VCGVRESGALTARSSKRHPWAYYCLANVQRGAAVCSNNVGLPLHDLDEHVLTMFENRLLDPDAIRAGIEAAAAHLGGGDDGAQREALRDRLKKIDDEIVNLTAAIATAGASPALVQALHDREAQRTRIVADLRQCDLLDQARRLDVRSIEAELAGRVVDWRGLLRANGQQARQVLRKLLVGRLAMTPNEDRSEWTITGTGLPMAF
jgi:hypothetical protein